MRILVCGDRNWTDGFLIASKLRSLHNEIALGTGELNLPLSDFVVIDGAARGADSLGHQAAMNLGMDTMRFRADWERYGRAAGPIRNQQMLTEGKPDLVLAFHDDIENSKGTKDMVARARKAGVPVEIISHPKGS